MNYLETLNCKEVDYEVIDIEQETNYKGSTKIKLNLPKITDDEFPTVSLVVPTYNRPDFLQLIIRNWESVDYPKDKIELIILDDSKNAKVPKGIKDDRVRYIIMPKKLTIGQKRNLLCKYAKNQYIVHMDDDDWYPSISVACRIRILLEFEKITGKDCCFGCTKVLCLDLISNLMFEAFDSSKEGLPATISESTMAYSKKYWEKQNWDNSYTYAECLPFIKDRVDTICSGPSIFIVTQLSHGKNTVYRRVERNPVSEYNFINFENTLSVYDSKIYNNIRASVVKNIPSYRESIDFVIKHRDNYVHNKFIKEYKKLDEDIKSNPLVIDFYREKMISKTETTGKDIVYYCGPGKLLNFRNKWSPSSKQLGGSEEAVIYLTKEFAKKGYNVTVYCVLEGNSKVYDDVNYKPYYEWIPGDKQDITIIWRDPTNCNLFINSKQVYLDLHDVVDSDIVANMMTNKYNTKIMTKSNFHKSLIDKDNKYKGCVIPNGIYTANYNPELKNKNMLVCTSSPDRCIIALLRALPLIRKEIPDAEIHWAYGFKSGISEGGMEKDIRTKKWVAEVKELIDNTPGFINLGRLDQTEVNRLYEKACYFIYPTRFPEIDCISLTKAMSNGCIPICTPCGAIAEKLNIPANYSNNFAKLTSTGIDYSLEEGVVFDNFVKSVIYFMKNNNSVETNKYMSEYINSRYSWEIVGQQWIKQFTT